MVGTVHGPCLSVVAVPCRPDVVRPLGTARFAARRSCDDAMARARAGRVQELMMEVFGSAPPGRPVPVPCKHSGCVGSAAVLDRSRGTAPTGRPRRAAIGGWDPSTTKAIGALPCGARRPGREGLYRRCRQQGADKRHRLAGLATPREQQAAVTARVRADTRWPSTRSRTKASAWRSP